MDVPAARPAPGRWLRLASVVVPALLFLGVLGYATFDQASVPQPGDRAPAFTGPRLDGSGQLSLHAFRGRPVFVNFWASWCVPCEDEAPMLRRALARYGDRVAFLGVNIKDARSDARAFVRRHELDYPHVRDEDGAIFAAYGLTGQPESFLIDADGVMVQHVPGAIPSQGSLFELLELLIARDA